LTDRGRSGKRGRVGFQKSLKRTVQGGVNLVQLEKKRGWRGDINGWGTHITKGREIGHRPRDRKGGDKSIHGKERGAHPENAERTPSKGKIRGSWHQCCCKAVIDQARKKKKRGASRKEKCIGDGRRLAEIERGVADPSLGGRKDNHPQQFSKKEKGKKLGTSNEKRVGGQATPKKN